MNIVVARYNENISWTEQFPNVIIYNKGENSVPGSIPLPNVGREGHTYYTHIYNNYDNLAEYTAFLQGNPFDHSPNLISDLDNFSKEPKGDFRFLSRVLKTSMEQDDYYSKNIPVKEVYHEVFGEQQLPEGHFLFGPGAQFIVSRKLVHRKPREFYKRIISVLEKEVNPVEGHAVERLHSLFFTHNTHI